LYVGGVEPASVCVWVGGFGVRKNILNKLVFHHSVLALIKAEKEICLGDFEDFDDEDFDGPHRIGATSHFFLFFFLW
jgi:hypothetical protein